MEEWTVFMPTRVPTNFQNLTFAGMPEQLKPPSNQVCLAVNPSPTEVMKTQFALTEQWATRQSTVRLNKEPAPTPDLPIMKSTAWREDQRALWLTASGSAVRPSWELSFPQQTRLVRFNLTALLCTSLTLSSGHTLFWKSSMAVTDEKRAQQWVSLLSLIQATETDKSVVNKLTWGSGVLCRPGAAAPMEKYWRWHLTEKSIQRWLNPASRACVCVCV